MLFRTYVAGRSLGRADLARLVAGEPRLRGSVALVAHTRGLLLRAHKQVP